MDSKDLIATSAKHSENGPQKWLVTQVGLAHSRNVLATSLESI